MGKKILRIIGKIFAVCIGVVLAAALILTVITAVQNLTAGEKTISGSSHWMAELPDDINLADAALPGTHDSGTKYVQLSFFSKCQGLEIKEQLESGFRYLDIRLGEEESKDAGSNEARLKLMHGFTTCKTGVMPWSKTLYLSDVLEDCYRFLGENPTETIVFAVTYEHGDLETAEVQKLLYDEIKGRRHMWYLNTAMPTLGEARGRIVLARRFEDAAELKDEAGIQFNWVDQPGSENTKLSAKVNENPECILTVQDRYEYNAEDKWQAYADSVENSNEPDDNRSNVHLNFLSTKGTLAYGHPYSFAKKLNAKLLDYNETEQTDFGWTIVDFGNAGIAEKIYKSNFK